MTEENVVTGAVQPKETKPMTAWQKVWGIFFDPRKSFSSLSERPTWIFPVIVLIIIAMISSVLVAPFRIQETIEKIDQNPQLTAEQKEQIIEDIQERQAKPWMKLISYGIGPIVAIFFIVVIVSAVLYFGGNVLLGGDAGFKQVLSVYSWSSLVSIPAIIVKTPLMLIKNSVHVHTSLAAIMPSGSDESVIFKILTHTDIFTIWEICLISIGLAVVYRFSTKRSAWLVIFLYLIYVMGSVGFSLLTRGRFMMG